MGPFSGKLMQTLARFSLSSAKLIILRDHASKRFVRQVGVKGEEIRVCADSAFLLESAPAARALEILQAHGVPSDHADLIGITPNMRVYHRSEGTGGKNHYVRLLSELIDHVKDTFNAQVILIPCEFRSEGPDDSWLIGQVLKGVSSTRGVYVVDEEYTAGELKAIAGQLAVLIASRFHSALASLSMGVPTIVLGWAHKYVELMRAMDQQHYVLSYEDVTLQDLVTMLDQMWPRRAEISGALTTRVHEAEESARAAAVLASGVVLARRQSAPQDCADLGQANAG
jgi:colanic acid/amylovoran biosynthesis protein